MDDPSARVEMEDAFTSCTTHLRRRDMDVARPAPPPANSAMGPTGFCPAVVEPFPRQLALARGGLEADLQRVVLVEMESRI